MTKWPVLGNKLHKVTYIYICNGLKIYRLKLKEVNTAIIKSIRIKLLSTTRIARIANCLYKAMLVAPICHPYPSSL